VIERGFNTPLFLCHVIISYGCRKGPHNINSLIKGATIMPNRASALAGFDYSPFGVGLETLFDRLESYHGHSTSYPPYNIIKNDSTNFDIEVALAGFKRDQIEVTTEQNVLTVASKIKDKDLERTYVHRGLSQRSFKTTWQLGDDVRVAGVTFTDGLLKINLEKVVPDHQKRITYDVTAALPVS
tara:strand:- start:2265 stop:2816 length:552 start_codon:yes stop_codon:yes gene_type:complete